MKGGASISMELTKVVNGWAASSPNFTMVTAVFFIRSFLLIKTQKNKSMESTIESVGQRESLTHTHTHKYAMTVCVSRSRLVRLARVRWSPVFHISRWTVNNDVKIKLSWFEYLLAHTMVYWCVLRANAMTSPSAMCANNDNDDSDFRCYRCSFGECVRAAALQSQISHHSLHKPLKRFSLAASTRRQNGRREANKATRKKRTVNTVDAFIVVPADSWNSMMTSSAAAVQNHSRIA